MWGVQKQSKKSHLLKTFHKCCKTTQICWNMQMSVKLHSIKKTLHSKWRNVSLISNSRQNSNQNYLKVSEKWIQHWVNQKEIMSKNIEINLALAAYYVLHYFPRCWHISLAFESSNIFVSVVHVVHVKYLTNKLQIMILVKTIHYNTQYVAFRIIS